MLRSVDEQTRRNEELATAILKDKVKPNRLMVDQSSNDDNSVVGLSQVDFRLVQIPFIYVNLAFLLPYSMLLFSTVSRQKWTNWVFSEAMLYC